MITNGLLLPKTLEIAERRKNYAKIWRCTILGILAIVKYYKTQHTMTIPSLNLSSVNHLLAAWVVLCASLLANQAFGQCSGDPIQGFEVAQITHTTGNQANGTIEVQVSGGDAPFVYTLMADFGGKGKEVVSTSAATTQRAYTFRKIASTTDVRAIGYTIEVQSANGSDPHYPVALCQQRMISNLEVK